MDGGHSGFGQGRGGNEGMSGAPMWQIKAKMEQYEKQRLAEVENYIRETEEKKRPADPPNVLVDAVASGVRTAKPLVRHVLVKDLNAVAKSKRVEFPTGDLFANKAPIGLYALFDGQVSGEDSGPAAAEFCARNLHIKVMENLAMLKQGSGTAAFVKAALIKSFQDLDAEYLRQAPPDSTDGCAAAVALLLGEQIFLATLGPCIATLAEALLETDVPKPAGAPNAGQAAFTGSLGEPKRKRAGLSCTPEVYGMPLMGHVHHPFLLLGSTKVQDVMSAGQLVELAREFNMQPRAACGDLVARILEEHTKQGAKVPPQLVLVETCFLPPKEKPEDPKKATAAPPAKKPKVAGKPIQSVRLRHVMLKVLDATGKPPGGAAGASAAKTGKPPKPRTEAEGLLRDALKELRVNLAEASKAPKTPTDLVIFQGKKFGELCRKLSDCPTAQKGGAMCGDLGWLSMDELSHMGGNLREKVEPLAPGQWSDICLSDRGMHIAQRVA